MNIEEAKEILKDIDTTDFYNTYSEYTFPDKEVKEKCVAIKTVLSELKKKDDQIEYIKNEYGRTIEEKDKVINEMAKWLYEDDTSFGYGNLAEVNTPEKIKEYFTNKVEREGK